MPDSLPAASDVEISRIESTADFFSLLSLLLFLPTAEIAQGIKDRTLEADMRALLDELGLEKPETAPLSPTTHRATTSSTPCARHTPACSRILKSPWSLSPRCDSSTCAIRRKSLHLGIELEFLGRAHTNLASALRTRDEKSRGFWEGAIRAFNPHMRSWAIDFFESCRRNAQDPFYSRIGRIGCIFMMDYLSRSHEKEDGES